MNVGSVLANRRADHTINQADDRRVVGAFQQIGRFAQFIGEIRQIEFFAEVGHRLAVILGTAFVGAL